MAFLLKKKKKNDSSSLQSDLTLHSPLKNPVLICSLNGIILQQIKEYTYIEQPALHTEKLAPKHHSEKI